MANTKLTPRKQSPNDELRCAMCNQMFETEEEWQTHTLDCAKKRRVKKFKFSECTYATNKSCDMKRHKSKMHQKSNEEKKVVESDTTDWEKQDPGSMADVIGDVSEDERVVQVTLTPPVTTDPSLEIGRIVRKPTPPRPVGSDLKRKFHLSPKKIGGAIKKKKSVSETVRRLKEGAQVEKEVTEKIDDREVTKVEETQIETEPAPELSVSESQDKEGSDEKRPGRKTIDNERLDNERTSETIPQGCRRCATRRCPTCGRENARLIRRVRKVKKEYQEGGKSIVEIEEDEFEW